MADQWGDAPPLVQPVPAQQKRLAYPWTSARPLFALPMFPTDEFEDAVESDEPPTVTALAERGKKLQPKPLVDLEGRSPEGFWGCKCR